MEVLSRLGKDPHNRRLQLTAGKVGGREYEGSAAAEALSVRLILTTGRSRQEVGMRIRGVALILTIATILLPPTELVQAGSAPRCHDGFFLRWCAGPGYASTSLDFEDPRHATVEYDDFSGDSNLAIGVIVVNNLALHGTLWGWVMRHPNLSLDGDELLENIDGNLSMGAFGLGITYYFMPSNLYVTGSVGVGQSSLHTDAFDLAFNSDYGPVLDVGLGKEWWVSHNWGLGLTGAFGFHSVEDEFNPENWNGINFAVRLSATFN